MDTWSALVEETKCSAAKADHLRLHQLVFLGAGTEAELLAAVRAGKLTAYGDIALAQDVWKYLAAHGTPEQIMSAAGRWAVTHAARASTPITAATKLKPTTMPPRPPSPARPVAFKSSAPVKR